MKNITSKPVQLAEQKNAESEGFERFFGLVGEDKSSEKDLLPEIAKVAVGVLAWPIARLSKQDRADGFTVRRLIKEGDTTAAIELTVMPDPKLGMPTMVSMRLLFAFMKLGYEQKEKLGYVPEFIPVGSWNHLCEMVGIRTERVNRTLLKHHLEVLHSTLVTSKKAFKTSRRTEGISDKFTLVPSIKYKGDKDADGIPYDQTYIALSKPLRESIENNYVKTIDLRFIAQLKTDIAQLLYTKLSYLFQKTQGQVSVEVTYQWLAETMGLKIWNEIWRAKQQLNPAFDELMEQNYIDQLPEWNDWNIRIFPGIRFSMGEQLQLKARRDAVKQKRKEVRLSEQTLSIKHKNPPPQDDREGILARQAVWMLAGKQPDISKLNAFGLTIDDVKSKVDELKRPLAK